MPTRQCSPAILGGLWPESDADGWSDVAHTLLNKANRDASSAADIRRSADGLYPENSGHMIDGMHRMYMRDAMAVMDQSDLYQSMSNVVDEVAQLIYHARTQLDEIDRVANEKIEQLKAAAQGGGIGASLRLSALVSEIAAVVSAARSAAEALSASIAAEIPIQVARIATVHTPSSTAPPLDGVQVLDFAGGSPRNGGTPAGWMPPPLSPNPSDLPSSDELEPGANAPAPGPNSNPPQNQRPPVDPKTNKKPGSDLPVSDMLEQDSSGIGGPNQIPVARGPSRPMPPTAGSAIPLSSGSSGGLNFPSTGMPSTGMPTSAPSAAALSSGLTSPAAVCQRHPRRLFRQRRRTIFLAV